MSIEFRKMSDFNRGILFGFTNDDLISAQRMYESVGFEIQKKRNEKNITDFVGEHIEYVYFL